MKRHIEVEITEAFLNLKVGDKRTVRANVARELVSDGLAKIVEEAAVVVTEPAPVIPVIAPLAALEVVASSEIPQVTIEPIAPIVQVAAEVVAEIAQVASTPVVEPAAEAASVVEEVAKQVVEVKEQKEASTTKEEKAPRKTKKQS
jgi:hypothetical protein